jgi:hypothetical protein
MAYEIHIARRAPEGQILPIALSEWRTIVQQTENVRMAEGDFEIIGEIIRLCNAGGDAEAFFRQRLSGCVCFAGHLPAESQASLSASRRASFARSAECRIVVPKRYSRDGV